jgi:hypothetical protein
MPFPLPIKIS